MSRASTSSQRSLTLTEELEKLEQSITLTLQEIDHNFSRAHRIVTTSILPIVEQYAEHSKNVWESSKFWKQFFEASANVSLSGYEESPAEDESVTEDTTQTPSSSHFASPSRPADDETSTPENNRRHIYRPGDEDSVLSPSPSHSTPRPTAQNPTLAPYSSPYETLKREVLPPSSVSTSNAPSTPRQRPFLPSEESLPSSPFLPPSTARHRTPANDPLLHRILDKNWRLQATPHTQLRTQPYRSGKDAETPLPSTRKTAFKDPEDLGSSPDVPPPELHAEIFDSPVRRLRVPGVSVLTPAKGSKDAFSQKGAGAPEDSAAGRSTALPKPGIWDSDSDDDGLDMGMSPPKTMQFHIPQNKLLRTPAREASKRIVNDLLLTAGGDLTEESENERVEEEDSPSVVRRAGGLEDDTF